MKNVITFRRPVYLAGGVSVGGFEEERGPLGEKFDFCDPTDRFGEDTWEKAETGLGKTLLGLLFAKLHLVPEQVDCIFGGDLQNQCVASSRSVLPYALPFLGLYGACSTVTEGLLAGALSLQGGEIQKAVAFTTSHNCAAERQFRKPLEYGGQRTPTAQWTATAGGAFLLSGEKSPVRIAKGIVGRPVDSGIQDASNMGAGMAPGAADTVLRYFSEENPEEYDLVVTGDLGKTGSKMFLSLLESRGLSLREKHRDCGLLLYGKNQDAHSGASGCGCSASVLAAEFYPRLLRGEYRKILFLSTGALMSPSSLEQGESILGIAPGVCLVSEEGCGGNSI